MIEILPGPAYRIHTRRLIIRCWEPKDAPLLKAAVDANLDHLQPWLPWAQNDPEPLQKKIDLLRRFRGQFDLGQDFTYAIFNQDENQVLGGTGLHIRAGEDAREIGYWIHRDFINQGFATEVAAALTRVAFEIDQVKRVEIHCDSENIPSAAVPKKLGYCHEATLRRRLPLADGKMRDKMIWTLFKEEYASSPAASAELEAFDAINRSIL